MRRTVNFIAAVLTAFHFSALGNYLVDQDGKRVVPKGPLLVVCTQNEGTMQLHGTLQKARGSKIWLIVPTIPPGGPDWYVEIDKPVCDVVE